MQIAIVQYDGAWIKQRVKEQVFGPQTYIAPPGPELEFWNGAEWVAFKSVAKHYATREDAELDPT